MEKLKTIFMVFSLIGILICFGASVWLYLKGFGMLYMVLFFVALLWQSYMMWNDLKRRRNCETE
ncbi:MAG: hypothetical protein IJT97_08350 [Bacteroidaceae bacterium]|nr:hypothetical protein [Bacteroidaceae bacterium]